MNTNTAKALEGRDEFDINDDFDASFTRIEELSKGEESIKSRSLKLAVKSAHQRRAGTVPEDWAKHIIELIERDIEGQVSVELLQERDTLKGLLEELTS